MLGLRNKDDVVMETIGKECEDTGNVLVQGVVSGENVVVNMYVNNPMTARQPRGDA